MWTSSIGVGLSTGEANSSNSLHHPGRVVLPRPTLQGPAHIPYLMIHIEWFTS